MEPSRSGPKPLQPERRPRLNHSNSFASSIFFDASPLGRSRGDYGTKACVIADGLGRTIAFRIAPGQAHGLPDALPLLDSLPVCPPG